jgi:hypothetical protein
MFFVMYLRRELRRRIRQAIFIALGPALGAGLVVTVSAASAGVNRAEAGVLSGLYGVGTDRRRGRLRRAVAVAAALAGVALLAAACGGGSAPATAPPGSAGGSSTAGNADAIPYSQCMRTHGVPNFPDPGPNAAPGKPFGATALAQAGVDTSTPQFQTASTACAHLLPAASPAQAQQALSLMLRYAACMRAHGVLDFPDPSMATGQPSLSLTQSAVNSPHFQSAEQACRPIAPFLASGPSSSTPK